MVVRTIGKAVLVVLLALILMKVSFAYCPPYFAKIDSIENAPECLEIDDSSKFCGGGLSIYNHCNGKFYYYRDGKINNRSGLISTEEWEENQSKYDDLRLNHGIDLRDFGYPRFEFDPWVDCTEVSPESPKSWRYKKLIIDGVNVCNQSVLEKAGTGTVVKHWILKMYDVERDQDIVVKGRTIYEKPNEVAVYTFFATLLVFMAIGFVVSKVYHIWLVFYLVAGVSVFLMLMGWFVMSFIIS